MNTPSEKSMKIAISLAKDWMNDLISEPCDLENRIAQAIDTARREAYEECLNIAHYNSWSVQDLDEEKSGYNKACDDLIKEIRERINLNK